MALEGRVCVVTGATSGIGRALTSALVDCGARVWALGRSAERLNSLARETGGSQGELVPMTVDLEDDRRVDIAAREVLEQTARVDVLVHSAGALWLGAAGTAPASEVARLRRVNLEAPVLLTRALLPALERTSGQVVFVNSTAALRPSGDNADYAEVKRELNQFADGLRDEVNGAGIRVLTVYAGRTATPMQHAVHEYEGRVYRSELLMRPEDVVHVILAGLTLAATAEMIDVTVRPMARLAPL